MRASVSARAFYRASIARRVASRTVVVAIAARALTLARIAIVPVRAPATREIARALGLDSTIRARALVEVTSQIFEHLAF